MEVTDNGRKYKASNKQTGMMGFSIKLESQEDFNEFRSHYRTFKLSEREKLAAFANRWFDITGYRKIRYL